MTRQIFQLCYPSSTPRRYCDMCEDLVRERHNAKPERAETEAGVESDYMDLDLPLHPLFGELVRDQPRGEAIGIERHAKLGGEIGDGTDMILVPMGQHDAEQILAPILDELEVGHPDVDARLVGRAEDDAQVEHDQLAVATIEIRSEERRV